MGDSGLDRATASRFFVAAEAWIEAAWSRVAYEVSSLTGLSHAGSDAAMFGALAILALLFEGVAKGRRAATRRRHVDLAVASQTPHVRQAARALGAASFDVRYLYGAAAVSVSFAFDGFVSTGEARCVDHRTAVAAALDEAVRSARAEIARRNLREPALASVDPGNPMPSVDRFDEESPWWVVLGVAKTADKATVVRAYRNLAQRYHPDKGGSSTVMSRVSEARSQAKAAGVG